MAEEQQDESIVAAKDAKLAEAEKNLERFQKRIKRDVWGHDKPGLIAIKASMQMLSTKTGIYARIPIYCKGDKCPYAESCAILMEGLAPEGEACPVEIAQLQKRLAAYTKEFDLDSEDASQTDKALVEEIILMEINMERCKALMSSETSPVQMMVAGMSEDGQPIMQPQVSKAVEAYERFSKKRNADYNLLLATRKDKQKDQKEEKHEDWFEMIEKVQQTPGFYDIEKRPDKVVDAEYTDTKKDE